MIKILETEDKSLKFVGFDGFEEHYLEEDGSFIGLRPYTEKELRERARDTDIEEYVGGEIPYFLEKYIDRSRFADDMEDEWEEDADIRTTREIYGEDVVYLCWGMSSSLEYQFKTNDIKTYEDFVNHYEFVGLTEEEFNNLINK